MAVYAVGDQSSKGDVWVEKRPGKERGKEGWSARRAGWMVAATNSSKAGVPVSVEQRMEERKKGERKGGGETGQHRCNGLRWSPAASCQNRGGVFGRLGRKIVERDVNSGMSGIFSP